MTSQRAGQLGRLAEAAFPDLKVIMDDIVVDGDQTVYRWTLAGTNTGPGGTGKRVHISGFEEWRIGADGFITESRGHFDSAELRQLEPASTEPVDNRPLIAPEANCC
jgi:predicted ester cyclase